MKAAYLSGDISLFGTDRVRWPTSTVALHVAGQRLSPLSNENDALSAAK
jgi:hypothetical protein